MDKNKKCIKLICGAGNEDIKEVEKNSYIFASAGFNMIDVCAKLEVIEAAKRGIIKAGKKGNTALCVSIGMQDDIHFLKAAVNHSKCNICGDCIKICPQNALFEDTGKIYTDKKRCIGCSICEKNCKTKAIIMQSSYKSPVEMLLPVLNEIPDCVEFHCSSTNEKLIVDSISQINSIYKGTLSICIDRFHLPDDKIISLIKNITDKIGDVIIQADGKAMTGGSDDINAGSASVNFAKFLRDSGTDSFIILSGGVNPKSVLLAKQANVNINGIALGSYARKLVKEYVSQEDFWENKEIINSAIKKATELYNECILYL